MAKLKLKKKFKLTIFILLVIILILTFISNIPKKEKEEKEITTTSTTTTKELISNEITITVFGDLLFEQPFYDAINNGDNKELLFKRVNDKYFSKDDITIGNMEVPIGTKDMKVKGDNYNFVAPPWVGELISKQSIEYLSTANNHAYDQGYEGLFSTINFFKNNSNIITGGTFLSDEDRNTSRILEKNGIKVGILSYTMGTNKSIPDEYFNLVAHFRNPDTAEVLDYHKDRLKQEITNVQKDVDVMIVVMHWGHEYTYSPTSQQKEMAEFLTSLNVDIVVGSHSHCMQPIKWMNNNNHKTLIYYSLGNFVSADSDVDTAGNRFDNAYQIGLISTIKIKKEDNSITVNDVKTEPIVNYYDKNERNYELIPLSEYDSSYESKHFRYNNDLTKSWIEKDYHEVIDKNFR